MVPGGACTPAAVRRQTGPVTTSASPPAGPGSRLPTWLAAAQVAGEVKALRPAYAALLITAFGTLLLTGYIASDVRLPV